MRGGNFIQYDISDFSNLSSMIMVGGCHVEEKAVAGREGEIPVKKAGKNTLLRTTEVGISSFFVFLAKIRVFEGPFSFISAKFHRSNYET